ncbi:clumping factor A-like [Liolophura sinensis]|uniref:clumping factor A-like n=1 Tax=Liolophura sinensis TaxID=3198878 RepID=UPI0031595187
MRVITWDNSLIMEFLSDTEGDQFLSTIDLSDVDEWFEDTKRDLIAKKSSLQRCGENSDGKEETRVQPNNDPSMESCEAGLISVSQQLGELADDTPAQVHVLIADRGYVENGQVMREETSAGKRKDLLQQRQDKARCVATKQCSPDGITDVDREVCCSPVTVLLVRHNNESTVTTLWDGVSSEQSHKDGDEDIDKEVFIMSEEEEIDFEDDDEDSTDDNDNEDDNDNDIGADIISTNVVDVKQVTMNGDIRCEKLSVMHDKPVLSDNRVGERNNVMTSSCDDKLIPSDTTEDEDEAILSGTSTLPWLSSECTHLNLLSSSSASDSDSLISRQIMSPRKRTKQLSDREGSHTTCQSGTEVEQVEDEERLSQDSSLEEQIMSPRKRPKQLSDSEGSDTTCQSGTEVEQVEDEERLSQDSSLEEQIMSPRKRPKQLSDREGSHTTCQSDTEVEQVGDEERLSQDSSLEEQIMSARKRTKQLSDREGSDTTCQSGTEVEQVEDEERLSQDSSLEEQIMSPRKRPKQLSDREGSHTTCQSGTEVEQVGDEERLSQDSSLEEQIMSPRKRTKQLSDRAGSHTTCQSDTEVEQVEDEERLSQDSSLQLEEPIGSTPEPPKHVYSDSEEWDNEYSDLKSVRCTDNSGEVHSVCHRIMEGEDVDSDMEAVDKSLILGPWDEKHGRQETKRKLQVQREKKLKEVKKNWKDRRSIEAEDKNPKYRRIRMPEDSGSSQDEMSDNAAMSNSEGSQGGDHR